MALNTTLLAIRTRVREMCDFVNNNFVTDAELTAWINLSGTELYDLLIGAYGNDYTMKTATFTTNAGQDQYNFATIAPDFYKLRGVDLMISTNRALTLKPFMMGQRNIFQNTAWLGTLYGQTYTYRLNGAGIIFAPSPLGAQNIRIWYNPVWTTLVLDADVFDGIDGWEKYIIADVCAMVKIKQELDARPYLQEKAEMRARIDEMAEMRDAGEPMRITETSQDSLSDFWGNGRWGY